MDGGGKEFADWELLQNSGENHLINSSELSLLEGIEGDSEGIIRSDYFSLDSQLKYRNNSLSEDGSVESDNPSWIDPVVSENRYKRKTYSYSGEFWSDSGSEKSISFAENDKLLLGIDGIGETVRIHVQDDDLSKLSSSNRLRIRGNDWNYEERVNFEGKGEISICSEDLGSDGSKLDICLPENAQTLMGSKGIRVNFEGKGEISICSEDLGSDGSKLDICLPENAQTLMGSKGIGDSHSNGSRIGVSEMEGESGLVEKEGSRGGLEGRREASGLGSESIIRVVEARNGLEGFSEEHRENREEVDDGMENEVTEERSEGVKLGNVEDEVKRGLVWWKLPVELLKFCVFKISPVWSISIAAALVGFVILKRRLYKMKHKKISLQMKVTMDDKKVSQFMSRAARLNEAFSVVKRVPVIRPSLSAPGLTPWPVINLR